jgi:hypothetical protein
MYDEGTAGQKLKGQTSKIAWRANIRLIVLKAHVLVSGEQSWKRNLMAS